MIAGLSVTGFKALAQLPPEPAAIQSRPADGNANGPARLRDVTGFEDGEFVNAPHLPPYRSSRDGRIMMAVKGRDVYLASYEKVEAKSFLDHPADQTIVSASGQEISVARSFFKAEDGWVLGNQSDISASSLCDGGGNPYSCNANGNSAANGSHDCYDLNIINIFAPDLSDKIGERPRRFVASAEVQVIVEQPKTSAARIIDINRGNFVKGTDWGYIYDMFEMTSAGDKGHLLVGRVSYRGLDWVDEDNNPQSGPTDIVYSYYDPSEGGRCDATAFKKPRPISYAHQDPGVRAHFGFGDYPIRDPLGQLIEPGKDIGGTYAWVDSTGNNVFFTYNNDKLKDTDFEVECLAGVNCTSDGAGNPYDEYGPKHSGLAGFGLWTRGKIRSFDNMLANIDWGLRTKENNHRMVKIYDDNPNASPITAGWVRAGNGRDSVLDDDPDLPQYTAGNMAHIDSLENKSFSVEAMRLNLPRDVAWLISNGKATDVISFDESLGVYNLVSSSMMHAYELVPRANGHYQSVILTDNDGQQNCVQNEAASWLYKLPPCGEVIGRGRIEQVALGGFQGRGYFSWPDGGLKYEIPDNQNNAHYSETNWLVSVMIDPRFGNDENYRTLFEFPDLSRLDLKGRNALSLRDPQGNRSDLALAAPIQARKFHQIALRTLDNGGLELFVNGMLIQAITPADLGTMGLGDIFRMPAGESFVVGRGLNHTGGIRGWLDDFSITGEAALLNSEEICNKFLGSIVRVDPQAAPAGVVNDAQNASNLFQASVMADLNETVPGHRYLCYNQDANEDGWMDLKSMADGLEAMREKLLFDSPYSAADRILFHDVKRPDYTANPFCTSCHGDDGSADLFSSALAPASLNMEALAGSSDVLMKDDPRIQPSDPKDRNLCAHIPDDLNHLPEDANGCVNLLQEIYPGDVIFRSVF